MFFFFHESYKYKMIEVHQSSRGSVVSLRDFVEQFTEVNVFHLFEMQN